jgi:hypothetical protein
MTHDQPERPTETGGVLHRSFPDVYEMVAWNKWRPNVATPNSKRASLRTASWDADWAGSRTYDEAADKFINGWPEAVEKLRPNLDAIARSIATAIPRPKLHNDVSGDAVDIGAHVEGVPEDMMVLRRTQRHVRAVHVVVNVAASSAISTETIQARGGLIAGLVMALDRLGAPVSVTVAAGIKGYRNRSITTLLNIKDQGAPLDMGRVMFTLAHPAMLRRILFAAWENEPQDIVKEFGFTNDSGYGYPEDIPGGLQGDVYLPKAHYSDKQWHDPEAAVGYVLDRLRSLGVLRE